MDLQGQLEAAQQHLNLREQRIDTAAQHQAVAAAQMKQQVEAAELKLQRKQQFWAQEMQRSQAHWQQQLQVLQREHEAKV